MAQGHLIMAPSSNWPISISQDHIWRSSMTSASVTLHESNLSLHADTFVLCWMRVRHGKVTRHRKPEEWWITRSCAKAGSRCAAVGEGGGGAPGCDFPAMPTASPGRCLRLSAASRPWSPSQPPSPEVADSLEKRNHPRQMGPLTLAGPSKHCVLVTCHLLLFCGWNTSRQKPFSCGWDTKKKGKGVRKSWHRLSSLQLEILWKGWHQEKNKIKGQQKRSTPPPHTHKKRLPCTPTVPLTTFLLIKHSGPPGGDKKKRPSQQKCMQRKCAYKGH